MGGEKDNSPDVPNAFKRWPEAEEETNLDHIIAIEKSMHEIQEHLKMLVFTNYRQFEAIQEAREYLNLCEINQIKALQDKFE